MEVLGNAGKKKKKEKSLLTKKQNKTKILTPNIHF